MRHPMRLLTLLATLLVLAAPAAAQPSVTGSFARVKFGTCTLRSGSGTPEASVTGSICDVYVRTDTGSVYTKKSGTATNTGWSSLAAGDSTQTIAGTWTFNSPDGLLLEQTTETFNPLLTMRVAGGDPVVMYPYANGGWEMDLAGGMYFTANNAGGEWSFGGAGEFRVETGDLQVIAGDLELQAGNFHANGTIGGATTLTVNPGAVINGIETTYTGTSGSPGTSFSAIASTLSYGVGGAASRR
jgi:hypothetical protein